MVQRKKEQILNPTARENRRYILLDGAGRDEVDKSILDYIGSLGYAQTSPFWVQPNILAVNREKLNEVRAAFSLAGIKIIRVSGTIKGLGL